MRAAAARACRNPAKHNVISIISRCDVPKTYANARLSHPKNIKIHPRALHESLKPKMAPRGAHEAARGAQDGPKRPQEDSKRAPRGSKEARSWLQEAPKMASGGVQAAPRVLREDPISPQEAPTWFQKAPQSLSRGPHAAPGGFPPRGPNK